MTQTLRGEINSIVKQLVAYYHPQKIILFGSAARGDAQPDSDLDFFIVKSGVDDLPGYERYRQIASFLPSTTAIDALVYMPYEVKKRLYLRDPFVLNVMKEGKVLYGA